MNWEKGKESIYAYDYSIPDHLLLSKSIKPAKQYFDIDSVNSARYCDNLFLILTPLNRV